MLHFVPRQIITLSPDKQKLLTDAIKAVDDAIAFGPWFGYSWYSPRKCMASYYERANSHFVMADWAWLSDMAGPILDPNCSTYLTNWCLTKKKLIEKYNL